MIAATLLLAGCGGNGEEAVAGPRPEQRCVDLWNTTNPSEPDSVDDEIYYREFSDRRGHLNRLSLGQPNPHVTVGVLADDPSLCSIVASNPDPNVDTAVQYTEVSFDAPPYNGRSFYGFPPWVGSAHDLDPSLTRWNATADSHGRITLSNSDASASPAYTAGYECVAEIIAKGESEVGSIAEDLCNVNTEIGTWSDKQLEAYHQGASDAADTLG